MKGFNLTAFLIKVPSVYGTIDGIFSKTDGSSSAFTCSIGFFHTQQGEFSPADGTFSLLEDVCEVTGGAVRSTKEKEKGQ